MLIFMCFPSDHFHVFFITDACFDFLFTFKEFLAEYTLNVNLYVSYLATKTIAVVNQN